MNDKDFPTGTAVFLAQLTENQRANLATMAQNYGKKPAAQNSRLGKRPEPELPVTDRFPHHNCLKKGL